MYNLSDKRTIEQLLSRQGFSFKKSLGQNFLINPDVCPAMAESCCKSGIGVLEIGPGIGVLTTELAKRADQVVAVELDERLKPILKETLAEFDNTEVVFGDVMKLDLKQLISEKFSQVDEVAVCANLPYYITSPIVMMLLEERLPVSSVTVMVQKEAAERLCAKIPSRDVGAVTIATQYYSSAQLLFGVDRSSFLPPPNVDSAVIKLHIRKEPPIKVKNEEKFFRFVKACFAHRRKTVVNTVSASLPMIAKDSVVTALTNLGLAATIRAEQLTMEQFGALSDSLMDY